MKILNFLKLLITALIITTCYSQKNPNIKLEESSPNYFVITHDELRDKIKGAWAAQTIGVTYGGPTEFRHNKRIIHDYESYSIHNKWDENVLPFWMKNRKGLYDDIYMDLTFVEVLEREGLNAPQSSFLRAYSEADYTLWHANQQGRYNYLNGIQAPESGHWLNNPHADDIDFQIEADFAGIMSPGMPNAALEICDRVGHIMNSGDGYYGGVFVAGMYSYAFVEKDINKIINNALKIIPSKSTFFQCINDVVRWHKDYPSDWKKNWRLIEEKWGNDIGCPRGVNDDFNIDAKINAAYVVLGMLYGDGDFTRTLDISTRAGQDSDCNPATAMAVLAASTGFKKIPEFWLQGLDTIEDMKFSFTDMSLNDVYKISYDHAKRMIINNGGKIDNEKIYIKNQPSKTAPFEENFPGYKLLSYTHVNQLINFGTQNFIPVNRGVIIDASKSVSDPFEKTISFSGIGVVLNGSLGDEWRHKKWEKDDPLKDFSYKVEFSIDGKLEKTMDLPISFTKRSPELFFKYELPEGEHELKIKVMNPNPKVPLIITEMITYTKN